MTLITVGRSPGVRRANLEILGFLVSVFTTNLI